MSIDKNPRGEKRPHSGIGRGEGMEGGLRGGMNTEPCTEGGVGFGHGGGKGRGRGRRDK